MLWSKKHGHEESVMAAPTLATKERFIAKQGHSGADLTDPNTQPAATESE